MIVGSIAARMNALLPENEAEHFGFVRSRLLTVDAHGLFTTALSVHTADALTHLANYITLTDQDIVEIAEQFPHTLDLIAAICSSPTHVLPFPGARHVTQTRLHVLSTVLLAIVEPDPLLLRTQRAV